MEVSMNNQEKGTKLAQNASALREMRCGFYMAYLYILVHGVCYA